MPTHDPNLWGASDAYERYMGRWSRRVAPVFIRWIDAAPGVRWIDIGCGTGVLTSTILGTCEPSEVLGIDSSDLFLRSAAAIASNPRVSFKQADAQAITEPDDSFDMAVSGLVLNFLPDKNAAIREMARTVRPGGTVALYVWDYAGHMQVMRTFFDVATALDPKAAEYDDGVKAPICRPKPLMEILTRFGLHDVEVRAIDIPAAFDSFDDYWAPFLGGTGSAPKYCTSLDDMARDRLKQEVQRRLPTGPDGEILLAVRAWAAKGRVE
ncbi:class I SAM-dependent methyltransferase [Mesorhizobium sp. A556]